ncbi:DNA replication/repair protein RecF [Legionella waltersii]|uniref:DNA replication and repair protein RecF n=1 Tax=Legionella waltersii TaxID=66969 RepID=A0A0W1A586_9GAMM|nr:DNA replication/repair protein RecF [Legionella waltersii]KTD76491.1 RecF recombinational DNA repair ATPase [Legionella waltersii]SNU93702.1 RecF recombinational DNA repair ATPase [Legionella waltersii]
MILSQVKISYVRNIHYSVIDLHPRFNFIYGPNGSGKSSILESLYLISCGHSFRTRESISLVSQNKDQLTVFAKTTDESTLSIQKSLSELTTIRFNNQPITTTSQLATLLPCQVVFSDLFQIIDAGPSVRRSVLDWGLFHVKHEYHKLWKEYRRVLKQRNALLRLRESYAQFIPWDKQLGELGHELDLLRSEYFITWKEQFKKVLNELTNTINCDINYYKGWDKKALGKSLLQILEESFESDMHKQYTQYGAQQADVLISNEQGKVKGVLSRGQQKLILIALRLAQGVMLDKNCLYLFDDLSSELDETNYKRIITYLLKQDGQFVITGVDQGLVDKKFTGINDCSVFNIEHGQITKEHDVDLSVYK